MHNPLLNPAVRLAPVENGYLAYDPAADRLHELNPVAALIVELCDGSRTAEEIRDVVKPLLPEGTAEEEVSRWIEEGTRAGLFTHANGSGTAAREELSAKELRKLAKRLRDRGKIETAYFCQHRATELEPGEARAWEYLGDLAHILGWRDRARAAYERVLELEPGDAEIQHLLIALRDEPAPPRASDECIQQMYKRFSSFFEFNLCEELNYEAPQRLQELLNQVLGERRALNVLELGCGSGLAGMRLKEFSASVVGVDLSPDMIELARARNIYDWLEVAEITQWLGGNQKQFDLIAACDCLIYFGDLRQVVIPGAKILRPDGVFAFTVERGAQHPFRLMDNGRYTHTAEHIREVAKDAGLEVVRLDEGYLRMEYGEEVIGLFVALRNPAC